MLPAKPPMYVVLGLILFYLSLLVTDLRVRPGATKTDLCLWIEEGHSFCLLDNLEQGDVSESER